MINTKNPGQVGHILGTTVAIAAVDFVSCNRILTGEIRGAANRVVVIGGKTGESTAIVARQDNGEDMHIPLLSAIYVDFAAAADAFLNRAEQVRQYSFDAQQRGEKRRSDDLAKAAVRLLNKSIGYRSWAKSS